LQERVKRLGVNGVVGAVRSQQDGRAVQHLALDDDVATREVLSETLQVQAREHQV